jgi:hypothetical protein
MFLCRDAFEVPHRLLPMASRAEELQVLQNRPIAFDVIDLCSGFAARSAPSAVPFDHALSNRVRHLTDLGVVSATEDVGAFDLNRLSNVGLPKRTVGDSLTIVTNELGLVAT